MAGSMILMSCFGPHRNAIATNGKISGKLIDSAGTWTLSVTSYSEVESSSPNVNDSETQNKSECVPVSVSVRTSTSASM